MHKQRPNYTIIRERRAKHAFEKIGDSEGIQERSIRDNAVHLLATQFSALRTKPSPSDLPLGSG